MSNGIILVVDDNDSQRRMFMRAFTKAGFEVDLAASVEEARALLAANRYDLILLDLVLETERCGLKLLEWLKANDALKHIPVVAISGHYLGHPLLDEAFDKGARDAVIKPLVLAVMVRKISGFIAEARAVEGFDESSADAKTDTSKARARVLIIEDDEGCQNLYRSLLEEVYASEFIYVPAFTGRAGLKELGRHPSPPIDIAIIDWNLPDMDGLRILRLLRKDDRTRGILGLMVTAHTSGNDAGMALNRGIDDFMRKPWAERELVGRLRALLRRREQVHAEHGDYELDGLTLTPNSGKAAFNGNSLDLTPTEFALLKLLLERPNMAHGQGYLREALASGALLISPDTFRKHLSNLRTKLGPWGERIEAVRGKGCMLHAQFPAMPG